MEVYFGQKATPRLEQKNRVWLYCTLGDEEMQILPSLRPMGVTKYN